MGVCLETLRSFHERSGTGGEGEESEVGGRKSEVGCRQTAGWGGGKISTLSDFLVHLGVPARKEGERRIWAKFMCIHL